MNGHESAKHSGFQVSDLLYLGQVVEPYTEELVLSILGNEFVHKLSQSLPQVWIVSVVLNYNCLIEIVVLELVLLNVRIVNEQS